MNQSRRALFCCIAIFVGLLSVFQAPLHAQTRVSDKDIEALMRNLKDDAKDFRPKFEATLKKSAIRKTSQEKDARGLVVSFEKQTDAMLNDFKKTKKGDVAVETTLSTAQQIDKLVYSMQLGPQITSQWQKVQFELNQVASAFGITAHYGKM
jgi:hypothetical protein